LKGIAPLGAEIFMVSALSQGEETQLLQTVDMFELITANEPLDHQSLEILKEAYAKLGKENEIIKTAKRIAAAYVQLGQLSSAILEYESVLQRYPEDSDSQKALAELELQATRCTAPAQASKPTPTHSSESAPVGIPDPASIQDGRSSMENLFVHGNYLSATDFNQLWPAPDLSPSPRKVAEPFIQMLAEKQMVPLELSLRLLTEKARLAYLPLEKYDVDVELARTFSRQACMRWCVLPFDRMSKSILVATANPFNQAAESELVQTNSSQIIWYVASPVELLKILRKIYR
jgi:tetratricopeptide (TPR) repeat protein